MPRSGFSRVILLCIGSALLSSSKALPQTTPAAPSVCDPPPAPAAESWTWDDDLSRDVVVSADGSRVRIVADTLRIDAATMPSLVRTLGGELPNVRQLQIDARQVEFRDSFVFSSAVVSIRTEHLTILPGAYIALVGEPAVSGGDGIRITADRVDLPGHGIPFRMATRPGSRTITISARTVTDAAGDIPPADGFARLAPRSLDAHLHRPQDGWLLKLGDAAVGNLSASRADALWPIATAAKAIKHQARVGYDPGLRARLFKTLTELRPSLLGTSQTNAIIEIDGAERRLADGEDANGFRREEMPRDQYGEQAKNVDEALASLGDGGSVALLEGLIVTAHRVHQPDSDRLASLRTEVSDAQTDAGKRSAEADTAFNELVQAQAVAGGAADRIQQRRERLARDLVEMEASDRVKAEWKSIGEVFTFSGSLLAKAGPTGAAVGTGLAIIGQAYTGADIPNTPEAAMASLDDLQGRMQAYRDATDAAEKAWRQTDAAFGAAKALLNRQPVRPVPKAGEPAPPDGVVVSPCVTAQQSAPPAATPSRALAVCGAQEFGKAVVGFADAAKKLHGMLLPPNATTNVQKVTHNDSEDIELLSLLKDLGAAQEAVSAAQARFDSGAEATVTARSGALATLSAIQELLTTDVIDDEQAARWQATASMLRRARLDHLFAEAVLLRRAFVYANGEAPTGAADVLYFPDEAAGAARTGFGDPANNFAKSSEMLAAQLLAERVRIQAAIGGLLAGFKDQKLAYDRRYSGGAKALTIRQEFEAASTTAETRAFIARINAEIAFQTADLAAGRQTREPASIPVPLVFGRPTLEGVPEQLSGAGVEEVDYADGKAMAGKELDFVLVHPGYGYIRTAASTCVAYDLRTEGAAAFRYVSTASAPHGNVAVASGGDATDPRWVRPPLRAPYALQIQVRGADRGIPGFSNSPVILSLRMRFLTYAE